MRPLGISASRLKFAAVLVGLVLLAGEALAIADQRDREPLYQTINALMQIAAPGRAMDWNNPVTGNRGTVRVIRQANQAGQKCWDFERTFTLNGRVQVVNGLACEIDRGLWSIVSEGNARPQGGTTTRTTDTTPKPAKPRYDRVMVRDTQSLLASLGYQPGPADGAYGPRTKGAVQDYQRAKGLTADGVPSDALLVLMRQDYAARTQPSDPDPQPTDTTNVTPDDTPKPDPDDGFPVRTDTDDSPRAPGDDAPGPAEEETDTASIKNYCDAVVTQSTSAPADGAPSEVLPLQFCLINSEFVRSATADTTDNSGICDAYSGEYDPILEQARSGDIVKVNNYLRARYGDPNVREAHSKNGMACVREAHQKDDAREAAYFALLMIGVGEVGYAELLAGHVALGFGVERDIKLAKDWMEAAGTALDNGNEPVVTYHGIERGPLIDLMVEELDGKLQGGTFYANRGPAGPDEMPGSDDKPGDGTPSTVQTVPGGPSAEAVQIASDLISYERDEITKTFSNFEYLLGDEAGRIEESCLADKSAVVKAHDEGSKTIDTLVASSDNGADQNLLLTTAFCRAVAYRADDATLMFYYDYVNYALGKADSAQHISYHYIVGNGVAPDRDKAIDWLTMALKSAKDADAKATIAELMGVI